jgi:hypothetical protein
MVGLNNMNAKEQLIYDLLNKSKKMFEKTIKEQEKLEKEFKKNCEDMHPFYIQDYKASIGYTKGYAVGYTCFIEEFNKLINMSQEDIEAYIEENKRIEYENKKYVRDLLKSFKEEIKAHKNNE